MPFDYQYRVFKRAYRAYKFAKRRAKCYKIYAEDFLSHYKYILEGKIKSSHNERVVANRLCNVIENHQEMLERYFSSKFGYSEFLNMMSEYNLFQEQVNEIIESQPLIEVIDPIIVVEPLAIDKIKAPIENSKETIDKLVREELLKYEKGIKKPKHIGHRIFGFYLLKFHPNANNKTERFKIWKDLTSLDRNPEEAYIANPYIDKNSAPDKTESSVKKAIEFCHSVGLNVDDFVEKIENKTNPQK